MHSWKALNQCSHQPDPYSKADTCAVPWSNALLVINWYMDHSDQVNWVRLPKAVLHVWLGLARTIHMYIYISKYIHHIYTVSISVLLSYYCYCGPTCTQPPFSISLLLSCYCFCGPTCTQTPFLFLSCFPTTATVVPLAHKPRPDPQYRGFQFSSGAGANSSFMLKIRIW